MKKLLFILLISILYVACSSGSSSGTINASADSASAKTSEPAIAMPYKANYSSDMSIGKQADALTVLNSYKAWETGDLTAMANTFADSVMFNFSDGSTFAGTRDSAMAMAKKFRDNLSSLKIDIDVWVPLHSNDKNEDAVVVWYKEIDTYKDGKVDSVFYNDINGIKDGKIDFVQSHVMKYKK